MKKLIAAVAALGLLASAPVIASGDHTTGHSEKTASGKKIAKRAAKAKKGGTTATTKAPTDAATTETTGTEEAPPVTK